MIKPWKVLETTYLHANIRIDKCELYTGQIIAPHLLEYDDEVMIFALTRTQKVVLVEQYRHGIQKTTLELPGGSVDAGESPVEAAKRELFEETGYVSDTFIEVGRGSPNPAIYTNRIYSFLALDVEQSGEQSDFDSETVEVSLVPLDDMIAMAKKGDLMHSLNIGALFYVLVYLKRLL